MPIKDKSLYPKNWKEISKRIRFERAKNKCEKCGAPNGELIYRDEKGWHLAPEGHEVDAMALDGIKFVKIVLTVAHLDHDTKNNQDENLMALCQRDHLRLDSKQHANTRKYGKNKNQERFFE